MEIDRTRTGRGALAGVLAAGVWALQQPLDKRVFGCDYDDVELLGRAVAPQGARWRGIGLALHLQNGALFGAAYANVAPRARWVPTAARGPLAGLVEHVGLWPLGSVSDRLHPARGELPRLRGNRRAFWQATWRHLLFGVVLGELERRLNGSPVAGAEGKIRRDARPRAAALRRARHGLVSGRAAPAAAPGAPRRPRPRLDRTPE